MLRDIVRVLQDKFGLDRVIYTRAKPNLYIVNNEKKKKAVEINYSSVPILPSPMAWMMSSLRDSG